ncbi:MAG TPA: hypothetical protein VM120_11040 [Bryobacteraceae bacterium]|nr:hypothetical protein [Bryobacteraceae bacterium]
MHVIPLWMLLAGRFWEAAPARQWSDEQLLEILKDSPWAQLTSFRDGADLPVYLATAQPMRDAEAEYLRRSLLRRQAKPLARSEYEIFLSENEGKVIVLAVRNPNLLALAEDAEVKRMEEESILKVGKKKLKMSGHFPPAEFDPVLRMVFPKPAEAVKELNFELYIPGVTGPYRQAVFKLKDLNYQGKPEM